jgi:asparagine synthase (glutamine-hydrolysing)
MCGIAGSVAFDGDSTDAGLLHRMVSAIRHRGPDGAGIFVDGCVGLAHARLSIIDIAGGGQPMATQDQSLWITFNGEIFNYVELRDELIRKGHSFATRSDTEVILHLYQEEGEKCVDRLNGQWAFAIWDVGRKRMFLSRDRFGVHPLFYTLASGRFLFASEIKALLTCPDVKTELDLEGLDQILTFWVTLPPRTAFRNINQLPPGHSLTLENGQIHISRYWQFELTPEEDCVRGDERELAAELLDLLKDATRIRLRSDVPVGAYLSGGLDSTLITALAQKTAGSRLKTFSVAFSDAAFDESGYQREAGRFLKTQPETLNCTRGDIGRIFPEVIWHAEQPLVRTAPAPLFLLARLVHESGFKVVLTGEGSDEIMGGYDIFKETKIRAFWSRRPSSSWRPLLLQRLYPYMEGIQRQPQAYLNKFFRVMPEDLQSPFFSHLIRWQLTAAAKTFLSPEVHAALRSYSALAELERTLPYSFSSAAAFRRAEHLEAAYLLPGYILSSQGDRMAMAHSVEGRYPFLDHRVVEFAMKLSPSLKMKGLDEKHLLKRAATGLVPESIRKRPKQPYRAPDGASFFGSSAGYVEHMLSPGNIRRDGVFDSQLVTALVRKFAVGRPTSAKDNMALVAALSTEMLIDTFLKPGAKSRIAVPKDLPCQWFGPRAKLLREAFS